LNRRSSSAGNPILSRDGIELHFFAHPDLATTDNYAGCYWRVTNADALHAECTSLGLPQSGAPSVGPIEDRPWGMREFALIDPNGNLIRIGH
jgi:hypothetical protein